jgi:protease-4
MSLAELQSLRDLISEVRASGKRVLAWSNDYNMGNYYLACGCDEILLQPGGSITALGVAHSYLFLADALERIGRRSTVGSHIDRASAYM